MNFLALKNVFQPKKEENYSSQAETQMLAVPRPVANQNQSYEGNNHNPVEIPIEQNFKPRKPLWKEPKRIQRLRQLAQLGFYGNSQIEGVKIKGTEAILLLKLYDAMDDARQNKIISMPMHTFIELTNEVHMRQNSF